MRRECRERFQCHRGIAVPTCITARYRHSRRMRNPRFYVSGKRPLYWTRRLADNVAPTNCVDIIQLNSQATDGVYLLYHSDGPIRLYCHNMAGIPKAYITLRDPQNNYGEDFHTGARTSFSRVAVDPQVRHKQASKVNQGPLLLTWFNLNPSMDK